MSPLFVSKFNPNSIEKVLKIDAYKIYVCTGSMEILNQPKLKLVLLLVHSLHWKKEAQCIVGYSVHTHNIISYRFFIQFGVKQG